MLSLYCPLISDLCVVGLRTKVSLKGRYIGRDHCHDLAMTNVIILILADNVFCLIIESGRMRSELTRQSLLYRCA